MSSQSHWTALPLELHTLVFSNLQPYDIFQVRQTCQALYHASSQRMIWMDALHRICVENALFVPSFPVPSMSVLELQHASMGPHRWIARSSSRGRNSDGVLPHSVTRHAMDPEYTITLHVHYLVPGGRYLFSISYYWLALWDLGSPYTSGREFHSIAAVPVNFMGNHYLVHSTPDGMGLRVFLDFKNNPKDPYAASLTIYEIYPERTSPQFTKIAYTRIQRPYPKFYSLSYDRLIFAHGELLTVWDFKANMWARWGIEGDDYNQILATKSAVMVIHSYGVSVWEIPPLLPESSLSMSTGSSAISPVYVLYYPENHCYHMNPHTPCDWYSDTLQPLYYDVGRERDPVPLKIFRFQVAINSEISGSTLNLLKTFKFSSAANFTFSKNARICQDRNVILCTDSKTDYLRTHMTAIFNRRLPTLFTPLCREHRLEISDMSFCPATGRVVRRVTIHPRLPCDFIVLDF